MMKQNNLTGPSNLDNFTFFDEFKYFNVKAELLTEDELQTMSVPFLENIE